MHVTIGLFLLLLGCSSPPPPKPAPKPDEEEHTIDERKPIETRRLNLGKPVVHAEIDEPPPLEGVVQITTWANDVYKGRIVTETAEAYVIDEGYAGPTSRIRRVPRSAVMDLKTVRR